MSETTFKHDRQATCAERWTDALRGRTEDLRALWDAYTSGENDGEHPDLGSIHDYGLGFDYVEAGTFRDQPEGYYRYQLSWGGPSDEFRLYPFSGSRITYVFMDWFDGEERGLHGDDASLLREVFGWFDDCGMMQDHEEDHVLDGCACPDEDEDDDGE